MLWKQCETADRWLQCIKTFTSSLVTRGFDAWLTSMGEVSTFDFLIFKNTCTCIPSNSIVGYLEFASLYKAFHFLDQTPILRLSKACQPALGIGSEEGVLPRMWNELTGSATTHFDMVIDMMNGERMDGWMGKTGKPNGETGKPKEGREKRRQEEGERKVDSNGETGKPNGETGKPNGETEKLAAEAPESREETWKSMEETSAVLVESMQNRLEATKEADWRWIEFC